MSYKGTIDKLADKGFGFIKSEDGENVFFHASSLVVGEEEDYYEAFENLEEGDVVEFGITEGNDGKSKASNVQLVEE